ncbi:MAG: glucose-6-phosphate isomerase [Deltaproteobacteria bacterium]|nr:glucose-6-phosphate isomerase [Deltaproteobacteria bacterium]
MGLIRIELENLRANPPSKTAVWPALERFLADMDAGRSGFFHLPARSSWERELAAIKPALAHRIPELDTFLHLGIGGSSLGAETIVRALGASRAPAFHFFNNIDPDWILHTLERVSPHKALLYVVTKSGGTMETLAQFAFLRQWLESRLGKERARNHVVFCTDPSKGDLRALALEWKIPTFEIPPSLGGRFSALSAVGLFPALVAGIDGARLLKGASDYRKRFLEQVEKSEIPDALSLASMLVDHARKNGRAMTVLMPYSQRLKTLSAWFTQLWAESLGKNGHGLTPIAATGATDQHSILQLLRDGPQDKTVGFVEVKGFDQTFDIQWHDPTLPAFDLLNGVTMNQLMDAELGATRQVLTNGARPHFTIVLPRLSAHTLGQTLYFLELLTALTGYLLEIDPFGQPGVEEGKILTKQRIVAAKRKLN